MNSPIKYYGGKGTMFKNIIEHFPPINSYNTYIEAFGGSFSVGLKKEPTEIEIYNDLEKNVYSLYKVLGDPELFILFKEKCDLYPYSEDFRYEFKLKLKEQDLSLVDRAFYYFYVNRTSHNGVGGMSLNLISRRKMAKSVSDYLSAIDRLYELHQRLSKVIILNRDGIELIKKYNTPNVFHYLDIPYEQSTRTSARYTVDADNDVQDRFLQACIESESKLLISGYNCERYSILEKNGFERIDFEVKTISGNFKPKTKVESLWKRGY
jgi:DNA adenine methylase